MNKLPNYIFIVDGENSLLPPAKKGDAGCDVRAISNPKIVGEVGPIQDTWRRIDYIEYDLGIKIDGFQPFNSKNENIFTLAFPRSSISNHNLVLANSVGIIDSGYRNTVKARFKYIFQPEDLVFESSGIIFGKVNFDKIYKNGDKICQLVFQEHFHPQIISVPELSESERNEGGFGSTGL